VGTRRRGSSGERVHGGTAVISRGRKGMATHALLAMQEIKIGSFQLTGGGTLINLVAASTNALNGAILARRPNHYKNFTIVGILLMALLGGIGGGATRDVIVNEIPSSFTNPAFITLCLVAGVIAYSIAYTARQ